MDPTKAIVPSPGGDFVALGRTKQGRLFRKHILNKGDLIHPVTKEHVPIDDDFLSKLKHNFETGVCDIVQVPLANDANEHTEDPNRNIGEVIGLDEEDGKVFALIDARSADAAEKLGKTLLGASAFMHTDYTDTRTGEKVGPTLLHVAVTNRPYVTGLGDYEELIAASADSSGETVVLTAATNEETPTMEMEALKAELKKHGIDLDELQMSAGKPAPQSVDAAKLVEALAGAGVLKLSNGQSAEDVADKITSDDVVQAVAELAQDNVKLSGGYTALSSQVKTMVQERAEAVVDGLIGTGHILPAQKDAMVELKLTNSDMFDKLVPAEPVVKLSHEGGTTDPDEQHGPSAEELSKTVDRYAEMAKASGFVR